MPFHFHYSLLLDTTNVTKYSVLLLTIASEDRNDMKISGPDK